MDRKYVEYAVEKTLSLLAVDSPTGYTDKCAEKVQEEFSSLGYGAQLTQKGGVLVDLGGKDKDDAVLIQTHMDTIGCMVAEIKENGRLRLTNLGGLHAAGNEGVNVTIHTRNGKCYEGTIQLHNPSVHVNTTFDKDERTWQTLECIIDEEVSDKASVKALGIDVGDPVCLETKAHVTESGYIKSRFLDDKLCVGIMLGFAKWMKDNGLQPQRRVYLHVTVYEEVGHGGSASVPEGVTEGLSMDMGCVGDGCQGNERKVSICVKDAAGPYSYRMVTKLVEAAKMEGADYVLDVFQNYGSDIETTLRAGADIRHGLIGPGVFASHCYERSHLDGVENTMLVLKGYLGL